MTVVDVAALTPSRSLPPYNSGDMVFVDHLEFEYQGPARNLVFGWGLKPSTGVFGADFNNGDNLVKYAWAWFKFSVPSYPVWTPVAVDGFKATFWVPMPGDQVLEGGGSGSLSGWVDTWVWITDANAIEASGLALSNDTVTLEKFLLVLDSDSAQVDVAFQAPPSLQPAAHSLQVRYGRP
ncbi:MAG: hypothetical protein ABIH46_05365 [Chloroflexota bacterium]